MQLPLQITFHDLAQSDFIAGHVRKHAEKLDTFYDRIMQCRVAIEAPHRHKRGLPFRVRIGVTVPGDEIMVSRDVGSDANGDMYAAIDAAFDDVERRLRDHAQMLRGEVKRHERARHGTVSKLFGYEGYGFLRTEEGDDLYFHRNSVLNGAFARMRRGSTVRYTEAMGDDGLHASTVVLLPHRRRTAEPGR